MIVEDQGDVVAFLSGEAGDLGPTEKSIVTHISRVFLKRDRALKLKQAVRFVYVDYSDASRRLSACQAELDLNRRTAPDLYLAVRRITLQEDGRLAFDGSGPLVDAVVEMRRFSEDGLFDSMALRDALTPALMTELARKVAAFHASVPANRDLGGAAGMEEALDINDRSLRATGLVDADAATAFAGAFRQQLDSQGTLLEARRRAGKVRRCHGDLILRNICLFDGAPTLFDCIEFSEPLATIDVLYDLAFLLMDLWHRDQQALASLVFNRYLDASDETDGLCLMPFFMAVRAAVRAHVAAAQAVEMPGDAALAARNEAIAYFDLASSLLKPEQARLIAIGGFSGSGKSTLAAHAAPLIGAPPGARVLNSDRIRKQMHGASAEERLPPAAYRPEASRQVYDRLFEEAGRTLRAGGSVIADAVFDRSGERDAIEDVGRQAGVPFQGIWLEAPRSELLKRVEARSHDPSDANAAVLDAQLSRGAGDVGWTHVDAGSVPEVVARRFLAAAASSPLKPHGPAA
jgi:hypothetical protein